MASHIAPLDTDLSASYTKVGADDASEPAEVISGNQVVPCLPTGLPDQLVGLYEADQRAALKQHQMSLDLFAGDIPVVDATSEIALKKNNFHIRVHGGLKLLERKLLNALYFVARPHVLDKDIHVVDLDYLKWVVDHNVVDSSYLKKTLTNIQLVLVQIDRTGIESVPVPTPRKGGKKKAPGPAEQYFSTPFIYDVGFDTGTNSLCFRIPESLRSSLALPSQYTWISLRISAAFQGKHSLALYEILQSWKWRGESDLMTVDEFRKLMGIADDEYTAFKRLSERVIYDSLKEIAEISDIKASVEFVRVNRKVAALKFIILDNPDGKMRLKGLSEDSLMPQDLFKELRDTWLLSPSAIKEIGNKYSTEKIREKVQVLWFRYIKPGRSIAHRPKLFMDALEKDDQYRLAPEEIAVINREREAAATRATQDLENRKRLEEEKRTADQVAEQFDTHWASLGAAAQMLLWIEFMSSPQAAIAKTLKVKASKIDFSKQAVKRAFSDWFDARQSQQEA